jgi:biopolymer transport protein ExbB/TolQ
MTSAGFIWVGLLVLTVLAGYACIERFLFFATTRPATPSALALAVAHTRSRTVVPLSVLANLGWLRKLMSTEAAKQPPVLMDQCEWQRGQVTRFDGLLNMTASTAQGLGLLGTVLGMASAGPGSNPTEVISLAMGSTAWGLVIAIPVSMLQAMWQRRQEHLEAQLDLVVGELSEPVVEPGP